MDNNSKVNINSKLTKAQKREQTKLVREKLNAYIIQTSVRKFLYRQRLKAKNNLQNHINSPTYKDDESKESKPYDLFVDNAEEEKLQTFKRVPFDNLNRVQFHVDGAIGLPISCTMTRVVAKLYTPEGRKQVGEYSEGYSQPESLALNPVYDMFMTWPGVCIYITVTWNLHLLIAYLLYITSTASLLDDTQTIIVRIDTLERSTLDPCTVGYAVIKLCSDTEGKQPVKGAKKKTTSYLNAGSFRIPIILGKLPSWCPLDEESIEGLPTLPGGYLEVRLFDAAVEIAQDILKPTTSTNSKFSTADVKAIDSCAELLYTSCSDPVTLKRLQQTNRLAVPHLKESSGKALVMGELINKLDYLQMSIAISNWMRSIMPEQSKMNQILSPNYIRFYDDSLGVSISVDMLYNMPKRPIIAPKLSMLGYKVMAKYLRATNSSWKETDEGDDPVYILDDCSEMWDSSRSCERCHVYLDLPKDAKYVKS
jgi:hypothetical protein